MKKWLKFLAFVLAIATAAGIVLQVGAANIASDINGDGKVTVFDAQMLAERNAGLRTFNQQEEAAVDGLTIRDFIHYILSGSKLDVKDTNGDGILEIYTADDLQQLHAFSNNDFILMNDLDLTGMELSPVASFSGTFDGNGKTISNFTIHTSLGGKQGFFAELANSAVISDLHLENAMLTATDAQSVGLLAGTSSGTVENCTVTGMITDARESTDLACMGALIGNATTGSVIGGTRLFITDNVGKYTTNDLCAKVAFITPEVFSTAHHRLVGEAADGVVVSGQWADTSNDSNLLSEVIQARRATVVEYMNTMGTAPWTPSEDLVYAPEGGGGKTYYKGTTYYGLPYDRGYGSYERFLSALNTDGTTKDGLGSCIWNKTDGYTGFVQLMGNHCSGAVSWAWMRVSPVIVTAIASHSQPYHGGAYVRETSRMIPNETIRTTYGIYPIGEWSMSHCTDPETGKITDAPYDANKAVYQCTTENYSAQVLETNGAAKIMEAYAHAHSGDALVAYSAKWSNTLGNAGHARLMAADPIVIRNADNTIDRVKSYIITTEQGSSSGDNSTWKVNYRYTFRSLLDDPADSSSTGFGHTYLPITMRALHDTKIRSSYVNPYTGADAITGPTKGKVFSNFRIISTTVTVKDGENVIYNGEIFTGISNSPSKAAEKHQTVDLSVHTDGFLSAAQAADLQNGNYLFSVQVLVSDGKLVNVIIDQSFDYVAP